jgi:hypothetical protein
MVVNALPISSEPVDRADQVRITFGGIIIISAMVLVLATLVIAIRGIHSASGAVGQSSDVIAVVGAVTTFLGTAIGLFFGVSAGCHRSA